MIGPQAGGQKAGQIEKDHQLVALGQPAGQGHDHLFAVIAVAAGELPGQLRVAAAEPLGQGSELGAGLQAHGPPGHDLLHLSAADVVTLRVQ